MSEVTTADAVKLAAQGEASQFKDAINDLLMAKVADALEVEKFNTAQSMFAAEQDYEDELSAEEEGSDEDI